METSLQTPCTAIIDFTNLIRLIEFLQASGKDVKVSLWKYLRQFPELRDKKIKNIRILIPEILRQSPKIRVGAINEGYNSRNKRDISKPRTEREIKSLLSRMDILKYKAGYCICNSIKVIFNEETQEYTFTEDSNPSKVISSNIKYAEFTDQSKSIIFISPDPASLNIALKESEKCQFLTVIDSAKSKRNLSPVKLTQTRKAA